MTTRTISYRNRKVDVILDVRSRLEWLFGHIAQARCVPVDALEARITRMKGITRESTILVYCQSGSRSKLAGDILRRLGYDRVIDGGSIARMRIEAKQGGKLRYE